MNFNQTLLQIQKELDQQNLQACLDLMEPLFEEADQEKYEDEEYEYHTFEEPVQEFIYTVKNQKTKKMNNVANNYGHFYKLAGIVEYQLGNKSVAAANFKESLKWNPTDLETRLLETELYRNDLEKYKEKNLEILEYAYKRDFIAQIYLNLAECFEDDVTKAYCMYYAHFFDRTIPGLEDVLMELAEKTGIKDYPPEEELMKLFKAYGIPKAPDQELMSILFNMGLEFESRKNYQMSLYGLNLLYDLNHDIDVLKKIKVVKEELGQGFYPLCESFFKEPSQEKYVQVIEMLSYLDVLVPVKKENDREFVILRGQNGEIAIPVFYEIAQTQSMFGEDVLLERMDLRELARSVAKEEGLAALVYNPFSPNNLTLRKDVLNYISRR
ncbi:MAG: SseB family protein [Firmicutes bacterium]|nr:SseB family protein [Bacillota bacterium]